MKNPHKNEKNSEILFNEVGKNIKIIIIKEESFKCI